MNYCTFSRAEEPYPSEEPSYEPSAPCRFTPEGWSTLPEDYDHSGIGMSSLSATASPSSEVSSQWTDGRSDVFAQLEIDQEHQCGIMSDYEGKDPSSVSCQPYISNCPDLNSLSPACLSLGTSTSSAMPPDRGATDVPANNSQSSLQISAAVITTDSSTRAYLPPSAICQAARTEKLPCAAQYPPRRGRGRRKLPEDKLKSV
ncbi:hypothetical protein CONLIGDRAFT_650049 [Coniochaeta ligniaria NRRL 30616]|uniref:Uncharacterized protein n=1 Tax=Coniochaeta ligniaria NRRL 30616 TaxID=1408157 RepID=A0A1J7J608_9PEZI|nr:hypothetical protein CONLIGDRAFT_650049 [Coniochaeta ligniaria NRRL 30616]